MKRAFTVIEMLAGMAIVAVLAALLIPVITKANASALTAKCISNMRQLGVGCRLYSNENQNLLVPIATGTGAGGGTVTWRALIVPYLVSTSDKQLNIFRCPADGNATQQIATAPSYFFPTSYGINISIYLHRYLLSPASSASITALKSPASTVMMADIGNAQNSSAPPEQWIQTVSPTAGSYGYANFGAPYGSNWGVFPRHNRKLNVLYYDGHGGTVDMTGDIVAHPASDPLCIYVNK